MVSRHREYGGAIPYAVRTALGGPKQFQNDTARRQVDQIEGMIADLERTTRVLEVEIRAEEDRTGINDPAHFAYSTYARATTARRDNLMRTVDRLKDTLNEAKAAPAEAWNGAEEAGPTAAPRVEHRAPSAPMLSATG